MNTTKKNSRIAHWRLVGNRHAKEGKSLLIELTCGHQIHRREIHTIPTIGRAIRCRECEAQEAGR